MVLHDFPPVGSNERIQGEDTARRVDGLSGPFPAAKPTSVERLVKVADRAADMVTADHPAIAAGLHGGYALPALSGHRAVDFSGHGFPSFKSGKPTGFRVVLGPDFFQLFYKTLKDKKNI
ncbi:MAG: hypothetical protein J0L50_14110 [Sphingomonadales bacterium]|nr:hypothetical protein [Sphingomonadales bacterium]